MTRKQIQAQRKANGRRQAKRLVSTIGLVLARSSHVPEHIPVTLVASKDALRIVRYALNKVLNAPR